MAPAVEARSGYWRLFFMKMQEEALKNPALKEEAEKLAAAADLPPIDAPERKKPHTKRMPLVPLEVFPEVRFKRKPIYSSPTPVSEVLPSILHDVRRSMESWLVRVHHAVILQKQEAANDADICLRILLLAA